MNQDKKLNIKQTLDEKTINEIKSFLTKKRLLIMECLYRNNKLSQGELAEAVGTSVASLSNILLRFELFDHKLLGSFSEGKRRYYYLTDFGEEYFLKIYNNEEPAESENIISHESFQILQTAKESLDNIMKTYEDKWERIMDDVLIACIEHRDVQLRDSEKKIMEFLNNVEKILIYDYERYSVELMKLFVANNILLDRFEQFLNKFEVYRPLLQAVQDGFDELQLCVFLEIIVRNEKYQAEAYLQRLQWCDEKYDRLVNTINNIVKNMETKDEEQVYELLNRFMAGNQMLSAILTKEIFRYINEKRENTNNE